MIGWLHRIICLALSYDRDFMFYFFGKRGFNCIRFSILLGRKKNTKGWTQPSSNNEHAVSTMGGIWSDLNAKVVLHSHCNCICQRWCMCMDQLLLETAIAACLRFRLLLLSPAWSACPNGCLSWRIQYDSRRVLIALLDTSGSISGRAWVGWDHCQNSELDPYAHVC